MPIAKRVSSAKLLATGDILNILISGSTGLIGSATVASLASRGHGIACLVRHAASGGGTDVEWHPGHPLDPQVLYSYDAVIHLAARSVAGRWNKSLREEILASRINGTRTISTAVAQSFRQIGSPRVLISASAIGYYGSRGEEILTENSPHGTGFLAEVGEKWEAATWTAKEAGVRVVLPRLGVVLSRQGGALAKLLPPFRLGLGGRIGSGRQYLSWITLDDVTAAFDFFLRDTSIRGPINLVAPNPVTNAEFTRAVATAVHGPAIFPLPAAIAKLVLGEMAEEVLLGSQRVMPEALQKAGFRFRDPELGPALNRLLQ